MSRFRWRLIGWSIPALLLLLPLVAMRFTEEVNWTASDFIFAAVLFGSVGLAFELIVRKSNSFAYRFGAALAVIAASLTIWVNGAVGMLGSEGNPYNLLFGGVLQAVIAAIGLSTDLRGGAFSLVFAAPWLLSAALFRNAASASR